MIRGLPFETRTHEEWARGVGRCLPGYSFSLLMHPLSKWLKPCPDDHFLSPRFYDSKRTSTTTLADQWRIIRPSEIRHDAPKKLLNLHTRRQRKIAILPPFRGRIGRRPRSKTRAAAPLRRRKNSVKYFGAGEKTGCSRISAGSHAILKSLRISFATSFFISQTGILGLWMRLAEHKKALPRHKQWLPLP